MSVDSQLERTRTTAPRSRQELVTALLVGALALILAGVASAFGYVGPAWAMVGCAVVHLGIRTIRACRIDDWHG